MCGGVKDRRFGGSDGVSCRVVSVPFGRTVSVSVHCTIPESTEACFLVVFGGGGGGVLLGRGGGVGCEHTQRLTPTSLFAQRETI